MSSAFEADERFTGGCTDDYNQEVAAACRLYGNEIQTIAILGAGVLGKCVVTELAFSGVEVNVYDRSPATLAELKESTRQTLSHLQYEFLKESVDQAVERVHPMDTAEEAVRTADLVIEMVPEDLNLKRQVAAMVEEHAKPTTILATSTMRLNIDAIAQSLHRPENVLGMRFLHPVLLINFVEVTRPSCTCDDAWGNVVGWLHSLQKLPFPGPTQRRISDSECLVLQSRAAALKLERAISQSGGVGGEGWDKLKDAKAEDLSPGYKFVPPAPNVKYEKNDSMKFASAEEKETAEQFGLAFRVRRGVVSLKPGIEVPDDYLCPITRELMVDPVIAADGFAYEREAIERWVQTKKSSPKTNLALNHTMFAPHTNLSEQIEGYLRENTVSSSEAKGEAKDEAKDER
eukprot:g1750.t1